MIDLQRKNAIIIHCSDFTSCWFFQIQTFPSAKLSFCSWCLWNELADYFKESSVRDCWRPVYQILEKLCAWLKSLCGQHHRGFLSLTFLTRGFLGSSSHRPLIFAALLAARYSSSVTSSLKRTRIILNKRGFALSNGHMPTYWLIISMMTGPEWVVVKHVSLSWSDF